MLISSAAGTTPPASSQPASSAGATSNAASPSIASDFTLSSAVVYTSTDASGRVITTAPSLITTARVTTDVNGQVLTVTQIVRNPGVNDSGSGSGGSSQQGFMNNTGAVAGVFITVGLLCTAGILAFVLFMLRRRRRQRLDRDVAAAAAAAAANSTHRSAFDDDDVSPAMTQYGGYYAATTPGTDLHGQPQPDGQYHDYVDPTGGYDHYATNLGGADRMSTATGAGLAGFGATRATNDYDPNAYGVQGVQDDQYHTLPSPIDTISQQQSQDQHLQQQPEHQSQPGPYYFDPNQAYNYAAEEDAYGGYDEPQQPRPRSGSEGSVARPTEDRKGLKITNV